MAAVRGMLARVAKLEAVRAPRLSPFAPFEEFEARCREQMAAGELASDFPIDCLARWETNGTWQAAYAQWPGRAR